MILTLTLNPAIDYTLATDHIVYDDRTYISGEAEQAGGKGIVAAQVIHEFGGQVHAVASFGGDRGQRFARLLQDTRIGATLIPVHGETRRNFAITDSQGLTIKLDNAGSQLEAAELQEIEDAVRRKLPESEWLLLTGSLPPGVSPDFYARLIHLAHDHNVSTLLDASGEALRLGLQAKPELAKPNRPEAERLLDRTLLSQQQSVSAVLEIQQMGPRRVILSLGSQGAVAASEDGILRAIPPPIQTLCPIGAGDVLSAICVWRLSCRDSFPEAFRWAVAAATAAAAKPGLTFAPLPEVQKMLPKVELRSA